MRKKIFSLLAASFMSLAALADPTILTIKETLTDSAIVYPESFNTDTHQLMQNWYIRNYTALDADVENRASKSVSDAEYIKRLKAIPSVIELPFNQVVKSYIEMYTQRRRSLVETMLGMSLYYMPIFEQALEKEGMPLELKYLPVIESALNPNAVSRVGATGLWQFMLATARGEGLEVNSLVDERRDPYRASDKAAKFLKKLYNIYGDWSLAIAAYNCGPANVNKAIARAGGNSKDFWAIYPFLPAETRGYVPAFIAANYVMTYFKLHNISPALAKRPLITDTVHVTKRIHLQQISDVLNIPLEELQVLNPHFRKNIIPGNIRPYSLTLPAIQIYSYLMSEDSIAARNYELYATRDVVEPASLSDYQSVSETEQVVKYHVVKKGESLGKIAKKYGVSVAQLKKWNKIRKNKIQKGQRIKIITYKKVYKPRKDTEDTASSQEVERSQDASDNRDSANVENESDETVKKETVRKSDKKETKKKEQTNKKSDKKKKTEKRYHKVKKGESLSVIAAKYKGVTVKDIMRANNLKSNKIKVGQTLIIPTK